jgi:hypothetical protein
MFNLFVTFKEEDFDSQSYLLERGRFGEPTSETLMKRFGALKLAAITRLKSIPSQFVYEAERGSARVGYHFVCLSRDAFFGLDEDCSPNGIGVRIHCSAVVGRISPSLRRGLKSLQRGRPPNSPLDVRR